MVAFHNSIFSVAEQEYAMMFNINLPSSYYQVLFNVCIRFTLRSIPYRIV